MVVGGALYRSCVVNYLLIFLAFIPLAGCSLGPANQSVLADLSDESAPLSLQILDEQRSSERLQLKLQVLAREAFNPKHAEIRLSATREGEVVGESLFRLSSIESQSGYLERGKIYPLQISVEARDATDYQVELVWGSEVTPDPAAPVDHSLKVLVARSEAIRMEQVESQQGGAELKLSAKMLNIGHDFIAKVTLGIGIARIDQLQELDSELPIPENEETLELERLRLAPGSARDLRLNLVNPVPAGKESQYVVIVRVVEVEKG